MAAVEAATVEVRRRQTRRALAQEAGADAGHTAVVDVVEASPDATVGTVATASRVDQPRASRLVAAAVDAGLVRRVAHQRDGRSAPLRLTARGRARARQVDDTRRRAFASAMADWSDAERGEFARLLARYVAAPDRPVSRS